MTIEDEPTAALAARKGRGAVTNATGRFERHAYEAFDDGWDSGDDDPPPLRTTEMVDSARRIITRNDSPDVPFDRSINPYRGCEHGCVYCFARPTHAYLGLSPGLDFESRLFFKPDAAALLDEELRNPRYRCAVMAMGTNTDPYQPIERHHRITRAVLEVLDRFNHPVSIVTKSALVARDADILGSLARRNLAKVLLSVTTLDRHLARKLEPRAATPERRLAAIRALSDAGVPVGVMVAPVIPALTDPELERILERAHEAGAQSAGYILLRLPLEIKDLFGEWLRAHHPMKERHVLSLMRDTRGGKVYDPAWGVRMRGIGAYAALIEKRFALTCERLGLGERDLTLDVSAFRPPPRAGDQMTLF